ncbi:glycosyltransferase family 2 protein [Butyrivibrio proteoclasticus]|uniref:glycosyltransferase family 2 protein n=1 Tax=Butyrivibrio proteoclasticus TaxID=43305 RepID=UPI000686BF39|nr:glycosyltransferase family 2 protein [Butyrivibrio proteoclasticus]
MTIDVIVPVYNVEKYIDRCVQSILAQEYENIKIILVDDGSTDESGKICDLYADRDSRVTVIHKKNGGLSDARNAGLAIANSEIISFVDGDDFIHPAMYKMMVYIMQKYSTDVVVSGIKKISDEEIGDDYFIPKQKTNPDITVVEKKDVLNQLIERDELTVVQWNKIFKKKILDGIIFPYGRKHEDIFVIHEELYRCERIAYIDDDYYYYVQRAGSIMHSESIEGILDAIYGYSQRIEFFLDKNIEKELGDAANMLFKYIMWKYRSALNDGDRKNERILSSAYSRIFAKYYHLTQNLSKDYQLFGNHNIFFRYKIKNELLIKKAYATIKTMMIPQ